MVSCVLNKQCPVIVLLKPALRAKHRDATKHKNMHHAVEEVGQRPRQPLKLYHQSMSQNATMAVLLPTHLSRIV